MDLFEKQEQEVVVSAGYKKQIGYAKFKVTDFSVEKELNSNGSRRMDITFNNEEKNSTQRFSIFVKPEYRTTQAGDKFIFVDKFANFSIYTTSPEDQPNTYQEGFYNFLAKDARKSFDGEELFMRLVNALEVQPSRGKSKESGEMVQLIRRMPENVIKALFEADDSIVEAIKEQMLDRELIAWVILRVVNDKEYTDFYPYFLEAWKNNAENFFTKRVERELKRDAKYSDLRDNHKWLVQELGEFDSKNLISRNLDVTAGSIETAPEEDLPF